MHNTYITLMMEHKYYAKNAERKRTLIYKLTCHITIIVKYV